MKNICILGKGSIGVRHAKIFHNMGCNIIFLRKKKNISKKKINFKYKEIYNYNDLKNYKIDLFVICNPTSLHASTLKKIIKKKSNIFVEKPLTHNPEELKKVNNLYNKYKINLFLGYMMRYDPRILLIKNEIRNKISKIKYANFFWQTYMPTWHPREDYKISYASKKSLGGGVLLTCSHEIDLAVFLFGAVKEVFCTYTKSFLKTNVENSVVLLIKHKNNITSNINLDFASKFNKKRNFEISIDNASLFWDFYKPSVLKKIGKKNVYIKPKTKSSIDKIYFYQNKHILNSINHLNKRDNFYKLSHVEKIIFAAKKSFKLKKIIKI